MQKWGEELVMETRRYSPEATPTMKKFPLIPAVVAARLVARVEGVEVVDLEN